MAMRLLKSHRMVNLTKKRGFSATSEDAKAFSAVLNLLKDSDNQSFRLDPTFLAKYQAVEPPFGFNGLGKVVYTRTYARPVEGEDRREEWHETVARVVEGCFSLQWRHSEGVAGLGFDQDRAQREAEQMYDDIFHMRFLPPGRGLWAMGTALTEERGLFAALNNCAFVSTKNLHCNPRGMADPFAFLMEASMLGVGVGFDTKGATEHAHIRHVERTDESFVIADSREGWIESLRVLIDAYLCPHTASHEPGRLPSFDYGLIRPSGSPIKGFGGISRGPEPLVELHGELVKLFEARLATTCGGLSTTALDGACIVDIMNLIGRCVVAGNVRRTAEISFAELPTARQDDPRGCDWFLELKDYDRNPHRAAYGWASNNSVMATVGENDYAYPMLAQRIASNGEPGIAWPQNMAEYGRMLAPGQHDAHASVRADSNHAGLFGQVGESARAEDLGGNPCLEQTLESYELCCLVECFPARILQECDGDTHRAKQRFLQTLQSALLYAKTVSLAPLHWAPSNRVLLRNRRIGVSLSGIQQFVDEAGGDGNGIGLESLRQWCESGYSQLKDSDRTLSERFAVRPSIKLTSIKPSGTVSLLAGATPGLHWPEAHYYIRRVRLGRNEPLIDQLKEAGYHVEPAVEDPGSTMVAEFPIKVSQSLRTLDHVTFWEQLMMASFMQRHWADNQVSCTVTFDPESEGEHLPAALAHFQYQLKGVSFLPRQRLQADHGNGDDDESYVRPPQPYPQMPYERISRQEFEAMAEKVNYHSLNANHTSNNNPLLPGPLL